MKGIDCIATLKVLGEETRLRILRLLFKSPMGVNEITERLGLTQYNVSKHLRIMREVGLLQVQKQGRERVHSLAAELKRHMEKNNNILDLGCCTFRLDQLPK